MRFRFLISIILITVLLIESGELAAQELSETFTTSDGTFEFDYPPGWVINEGEDGTIVVANMQSALDVLENDPVSGEFGMALLYGDLALILEGSGISSGSTAETMSSLSNVLIESLLTDSPTIVIGEAETLEDIGNAASYFDFSDQGYDGFIIIALLDSETFLISLGAAPTGELAPYKTIAIDIAASFRLAGSEPPGTTGGMFSSLVENAGTPSGTPGKNLRAGDVIRQWEVNASASTEFSIPSWAAAQATGAPDTFDCGDISTAWASATRNGEDWLRLEYDAAVIPQEIHIYQTYNPGSIVKVEVFAEGDSVTIELPNSVDPPNNTPCPGVFTIIIDEPMPAISAVTIYVNQIIGGSWNEIDAVELVGTLP